LATCGRKGPCWSRSIARGAGPRGATGDATSNSSGGNSGLPCTEGPDEFAPSGITISGSGTARMLPTMVWGRSSFSGAGCGSASASLAWASVEGAAAGDNAEATGETEAAGCAPKSDVARSQPGWATKRTSQQAAARVHSIECIGESSIFDIHRDALNGLAIKGPQQQLTTDLGK